MKSPLDIAAREDAPPRVEMAPAGYGAQQLLSDASVALTASLDLDETIGRVARVIVPSIAEWCVIDLIEGEGPERSVRRAAAVHATPSAQAMLDEMTRHFPPRIDRPTLSRPVIETGEPLLIGTVSDEMIDRVVEPGQAALVRRIGVRSCMVVPLRARERLLGVVAAFASSRCYDANDLALAEELARRIAMAVDNALLFGQVRESAERLQRLQVVTAVLARAMTAEQVAEIVIREAVAALHATEGILCLTSEDGYWLEIVRHVGLPDATARDWHRFALDGPFPLSEAVRTGEPIFLENRASVVDRYPKLREANARAVAGAWVALPLVSNGVPIGGLAFGYPQPRSFPPAERAFSQTLGHQCALALERARLIASERSARAEAERAADRTSRLQMVTATLAAAVTMEDVAQAVIRYGLSAAGAIGGVVCRLDDDAAAIDRVWGLGYPEEGFEEFRRVALSVALPPRDVMQKRAPVFIESAADWLARYLPPPPGMSVAEAAAALPLLVGDRLVGIMVLRFSTSRRFTEEERTHLTSVASQCAQALERARLYEAERMARKQAEEARIRADDANRAKTEFLAVMSHELRTPLNAIAGYAELLEIGIHGPLNESQTDAVARIQRSERHLLGLINDVLNFAKLEAGHVHIELGPVPVHETLAALEALVAPQVRAKALAYRYVPCTSELSVYADPEKVRQILLNLLSNAIKFTEPQGRIEVSCTVDTKLVRLHVSDTGPGIPADKLERIFEPFVQLHPGRTRTHEGTGLGLAISRDLAHAMHGEIAVESAADGGSRFTLTLPRYNGDRTPLTAP